MATYKGIRGYTVQKLSSDPTASEAEGQLWYNSTSGDFKVGTAGAGAWSSGNTLNTARGELAGIGTTPAALACGGNPGGTLSETYDGSTWTEGSDLNTSRKGMQATGSTTAGMVVGGSGVTATEYYDGTSWSSQTGTITRGGGDQSFGIAGASQASALIFGGEPGTTYAKYSETWNGTSWSEGNRLNSNRASAGGVGIVTAALACGGYSPGVVTNVESYDGTSWTETSTDINSARAAMGSSGTATAALIFAGTPFGALTESFDGTTWTELADLATGREYVGNSQSPTNANTSALAFGGLTPSATNATEAWTDPVYTIKTVTVS